MTSNRLFQKLAFLCLAMVLLAFCGCRSENSTVAPLAKQGVLDLSGWDFQKNGNVNLNGEWLFYWQQLLAPQDLSGHKDHPQTVFTIPGIWNGREVAGRIIGPEAAAERYVFMELGGKICHCPCSENY